MHVTFSTLISHTKLRDSSLRATGNQSWHFSFPEAAHDPNTGTPGSSACTHTHKQYTVWHKHRFLIYYPDLTRTQPMPIYSSTKTQRLTLTHTGIKPIQYQSSRALMHIYGKGEWIHSTEYQLRLWANRFIRLPVWKMNETEKNSTQTKCQTHYRIKSQDIIREVKILFQAKSMIWWCKNYTKRLNLILKIRFKSVSYDNTEFTRSGKICECYSIASQWELLATRYLDRL